MAARGTVSLHCSYSSYRTRELAKPKPKVEWENYCSRLEWGNQETIWPLSLSALATRPSPRLIALAKPKKNFDGKLQRSCGRESEIWERPPLMNLGFPSDRILKLAEPKKFQLAYLQKRTEMRTFLGCSVCELSGFLTQVSKSAQQATASSRTSELAKVKQVSPKYLPVRDAEWPVSNAAKHTTATPRTAELSKPSKRPPMNIAQFNPDAFTVKESAKKAFCSSRILELARPVAR